MPTNAKPRYLIRAAGLMCTAECKPVNRKVFEHIVAARLRAMNRCDDKDAPLFAGRIVQDFLWEEKTIFGSDDYGWTVGDAFEMADEAFRDD